VRVPVCASFDGGPRVKLPGGDATTQSRDGLPVKRKLAIALLGAAAIGVLVAIFFGVAAGAR